jgi:HD-GYP domain-containing protein (c-di-GMP phosphodiesterase class II)
LETVVVAAAAVWCVLGVLAFLVLRPALRAGARHDLLSERAARGLRTAPQRETPVPAPAPPGSHERAAYLLETGYLGLVHDRLCSYARTLIGLERSWLLLRDLDRVDEVVVAAARGSDPEQVGRRLPAEPGMLGQMLRSSRPTVLPPPNGTADDPGVSVTRGVRMMATAPVTWEGSVRGALAVGTRDPARVLGVADLELLGEVAQLSGAALAGQSRRAELVGTVAAQVDALATALEVWDGQTREHSDKVVDLARLTGARMGLDPVELLELELAALLHDVGKLRVPREILRKAGPLSEEERRLMRNHPAWGAELVSGVPGLQAVALIVRHHHERVDGSGYPSALSGVRIPAASRIMAVCDAYGAMTESRPYRGERSPEEALSELRGGAGSQFDPAVVEALEAEVGTSRLRAGQGHRTAQPDYVLR